MRRDPSSSERSCKAAGVEFRGLWQPAPTKPRVDRVDWQAHCTTTLPQHQALTAHQHARSKHDCDEVQRSLDPPRWQQERRGEGETAGWAAQQLAVRAHNTNAMLDAIKHSSAKSCARKTVPHGPPLRSRCTSAAAAAAAAAEASARSRDQGALAAHLGHCP